MTSNVLEISDLGFELFEPSRPPVGSFSNFEKTENDICRLWDQNQMAQEQKTK